MATDCSATCQHYTCVIGIFPFQKTVVYFEFKRLDLQKRHLVLNRAVAVHIIICVAISFFVIQAFLLRSITIYIVITSSCFFKCFHEYFGNLQINILLHCFKMGHHFLTPSPSALEKEPFFLNLPLRMTI